MVFPAGNARSGKDEMKNVPTSAFFNMLMQKLGNHMVKVASRKEACPIADALSQTLDIPSYHYVTSRYAIDKEKRP